jgi:hypothetical protein
MCLTTHFFISLYIFDFCVGVAVFGDPRWQSHLLSYYRELDFCVGVAVLGDPEWRSHFLVNLQLQLFDL